jgi:membrane fusion protein, multidrug efflux system
MPRIKRSFLIAAGVALGLVLWMASGQLDLGGAPQPTVAEPPAQPERQPVTVRVVESTALPVAREVVVNGRTRPVRTVHLRAEVAGRVMALGPEKGARVEQGEVLVRLDPREREAALREAEAVLAQREIEYEAAARLGERGFEAETRIAARRAELERARADLRRIQVALEQTLIRAPFAGVLERRPVEVGDFADIGQEVATVIAQDPFLVVADVTELQVGGLAAGMPGAAILVTGEAVEGRIRYIATEAHETTRTFRLELEVPNPTGRLTAGISAQLRLQQQPVPAHRVSSALLALDDAGRIGIKTVDEDDVVRFHPAEIARADAEAVWLTGLPDTLRVITVGQGFVRPGERVRAMPAPNGDGGDGALARTGG